MPRVFFKMMLFMKLYAFGRDTGISFVDSEHLYGSTTSYFSIFVLIMRFYMYLCCRE